MAQIISYMNLIFHLKEEYPIGVLLIIYQVIVIEPQNFIFIEVHVVKQVAVYVLQVELVLHVKKDILYLVELAKEK